MFFPPNKREKKRFFTRNKLLIQKKHILFILEPNENIKNLDYLFGDLRVLAFFGMKLSYNPGTIYAKYLREKLKVYKNPVFSPSVELRVPIDNNFVYTMTFLQIWGF